MHRITVILTIVFGVTFLNCSSISEAGLILTGAVEFSTDSHGTSDSSNIWNTLGLADEHVNTAANLYVTTPNTGINGTFLNSGDGPQTRLSYDLSSPGTYQFFIFGDPGFERNFYGLNLFFDGVDSSPRISAFGDLDVTPSPPFPAFTANSSAFTRDLSNSNFVPGSGSLTYTAGGLSVSLSDYHWSAPFVESLDRVDYLNNVPSGRFDQVGSFTLQVSATAVPEPNTLYLLVIGAICLAGVGWKRVGICACQ